MLIKFCGMRRQEDLDLAAQLGVNFCGFIFHPGSKRYVSPQEAALLHSQGMTRVGVFVHQDAREILEIMRVARLDFAQLHGGQDLACARTLGADKVIRVLWPQKYENVGALEEDASRYADACAYYLLDAGSSGGGSGQELDWESLSEMRLSRPWFLAGGLGSENVGMALRLCNPHGLDFNSGLESAPACKHRQKMLDAIRQIKIFSCGKKFITEA